MKNTPSDLLRMLVNVVRFGKIAEVDCDLKLVRVKVGGNLTDWRPWLAQRAGLDQTWWPPTVGEQVVLLSPEGDFNQSIILMGSYSSLGTAPSNNPNQHVAKYRDGAVLTYDSKTHTLSAILPSGSSAVVKADKVTSDAPNTICTGNLTVAKNLIVNGMSNLNAGMAVLPAKGGGAASIQGVLNISDDVLINNISFVKHVHPVVAVGADVGVAK